MRNMVEEFTPTSTLPKRGFLYGAAAERMKALFAAKHRSNAEKLAQVGIRLEDDLPLLVRPNAPLNQSGQQSGFHWDTFTVGANTAMPTPVTMFATPLNQVTKGFVATSLRDSGTLGLQEEMVATGMRIYILNNANPQDILNLFTNTAIQFLMGPTNYPGWEGLPWMLPAGGGLHISGGMQVGTAPAGANVLFGSGNGEPTLQSAYQLPIPLRIEPGEKFSGVLSTIGGGFNTVAAASNPPGTGLTIVFALEGVRTRQISVG